MIKLKRSKLALSKALFEDILQVFRPASRSPLLSVATILTLTAIVERFSEQALAGYGIGSRIEFLIIPLVFGLGATMTSLVGMRVGAKDFDRAELVGFVGLSRPDVRFMDSPVYRQRRSI
ncbi:MAG: Na+-driven multidrug efflux pump [Candidatus Azotimanducaceae bacterium]|jgi:Na+-driven multidrug efflux pump